MSLPPPEWVVLCGIVLAGLSGVPGLFVDRMNRFGERSALVLLGTGSLWASSARHTRSRRTRLRGALVLPGPLPGADLRLSIDAISAMFLIQIFVVSLLGAIYGLGYWSQREHPDERAQASPLLRHRHGRNGAGRLGAQRGLPSFGAGR